MTPTEIATMFVPSLHRHGFRAVPHPECTPNGYGHKITLFNPHGPSLGNIVIYSGKQGPRYTTSELSAITPEIQGRLAQAWTDIGILPVGHATPTSSIPSPDIEATPTSIDLWVDGACLQETSGLRFGWAYVVCQNGTILHQISGSSINTHAVSHRNVAAEIQAVISGLEWCRAFGHKTITIYHDYEGLEAWVTGRWKAKTEYTQRYQREVRGTDLVISWKKVPAHSGVPMNELVDSLATAAARNSSVQYPVA
jgi:ribonuclease HI